jgi:histone H2A
MGKKDLETVVEGAGIMAKAKKKAVSRAAKAGLQMPVSKINRHLRDRSQTKRVGGGAPVYLAAVLEYAAYEIFEAAAKQLGSKRKRITRQDIMKGIRDDDELHQLLQGAAVFSGDKVKDVCKTVTFVKPVSQSE